MLQTEDIYFFSFKVSDVFFFLLYHNEALFTKQ